MTFSWKIWWMSLCDRPLDDCLIEWWMDCTSYWPLVITMYFVIPLASLGLIVWRCERRLARLTEADHHS
jgi:hypothetical protein